MKKNKSIFILSKPALMVACSLFLVCDIAGAASRTTIRSTPTSRKSVSAVQTTTKEQATASNSVSEQTESTENKETTKEENKEPIIIENKSKQFEEVISAVIENATEDNSFAELIRKQRASLDASEAATNSKKTTSSNSSSCDVALRKCMMATCGNDFTKCALDGDTIFGDKLNKCKHDSDCSGEEFNLFSTEIKADRDMNVRLASYNNVIDCGNSYNACIQNECGTNYNKCLGKKAADEAIQKCATIAKECTQADSGLVSRFGTAIAKLRENAEEEVKKDDKRLYELRDLMAQQCTTLGAAFDERSFDCVFSVEFYAGENQSVPTATRKRYAGDTFICMQEWFGINATTFKENAYRETRSQTAASSAMLGSGLGTAAGIVSSGAIDRAMDTQNAKKELKQECEDQGKKMEGGKCVDKTEEELEKEKLKENKKLEKQHKKDQRKAARTKINNNANT